MSRPSQFTILTLQELNKKYNEGAVMLDLAKEYHVSFRTIQLNIWKRRPAGTYQRILK